MKIAVIDLDGCIADDRWRREYIGNKSDAEWDAYHSRCVSDDLNEEGIKLIARAMPFDIVLYNTGRPAKHRFRTAAWLHTKEFPGIQRIYSQGRHVGTENSGGGISLAILGDLATELYMRPDGCKTPTAKQKAYQLSWFLTSIGSKREPWDIFCYDDRRDVLESYQEFFSSCRGARLEIPDINVNLIQIGDPK